MVPPAPESSPPGGCTTRASPFPPPEPMTSNRIAHPGGSGGVKETVIGRCSPTAKPSVPEGRVGSLGTGVICGHKHLLRLELDDDEEPELDELLLELEDERSTVCGCSLLDELLLELEELELELLLDSGFFFLHQQYHHQNHRQTITKIRTRIHHHQGNSSSGLRNHGKTVRKIRRTVRNVAVHKYHRSRMDLMKSASGLGCGGNRRGAGYWVGGLSGGDGGMGTLSLPTLVVRPEIQAQEGGLGEEQKQWYGEAHTHPK